MAEVDRMQAAVRLPPGPAKNALDMLFGLIRMLETALKLAEETADMQAQRIAELEAELARVQGRKAS